MRDCKDVLRIPEDLDKLEPESDNIIFIEVIAAMESEFTFLSSRAAQNLWHILNEKQIVNTWCYQEKEK